MDEQKTAGTRPGDAKRPQESGGAAPGVGGRMSRQRKSAAVLRLLRGEDLETVSRGLGVTAATLTGWREAFLAAGEAALTSRQVTGEELEATPEGDFFAAGSMPNAAASMSRTACGNCVVSRKLRRSIHSSGIGSSSRHSCLRAA